jgi:hypothetical protein
VVGARVHRVDERRAGPAAVRRPLPAAPPGRQPASTTFGCRGARAPGGHGGCSRHRRVLLLPLLVRWAPHPPPSVRRGARERASWLPFMLCWANENWTRAWDAAPTRSCSSSPTASRSEPITSPTWSTPSATSATSGSMAAPVFAIYRIGALPDAEGFVADLRQAAKEGGVGDLHIVKFNTHAHFDDRPTAAATRRPSSSPRHARGGPGVAPGAVGPARQHGHTRTTTWSRACWSCRCRSGRTTSASRRAGTTRPPRRRSQLDAARIHPRSLRGLVAHRRRTGP